MREGATPWRRNSARSVCSSGARLLPLMRAPRLSRPSQANGMSRLIALTVAVAAGAMCYFRPASLYRDAVDFLETSHPVLDLLQPCTAQIPYAFLRGLSTDLGGAAQRENDAGDRFCHGQNLIDPDAALVAVGAIATALRAIDLDPVRHVDLGKAFLQQGLFGYFKGLLAGVTQAPG